MTKPRSRASAMSVVAMFLAGIVGGIIAINIPDDDRVVVEDRVVGREFEIIMVDGQPVIRREHGWIASRVPYALVTPGKRTLTVVEVDETNMQSGSQHFTVEANVLAGHRHTIYRGDDGSPKLAVVMP